MRRRQFLTGGAALLAAALTDMTTPSAADDDALLDRLRRADFGNTPFSRVSDHDDFESGPGGVFTRQAVAQIKAGSNAKRLARMHASGGSQNRTPVGS
jgi:hypothetical protein